MQASIQPVYTWSHDALFSGRAGRLTLLIEINSTHPAPNAEEKHRTAAKGIELDVWLEPHVRLIDSIGGRCETDENAPLLRYEFGSLQAGKQKQLAVELELEGMPAGDREAVWLQWRYRHPAGSRMRELPVHRLKVQHSVHTGVLSEPGSFYVEKQTELLRVRRLLEEFLSPDCLLPYDKRIEQIRRQGDRLLLMAVRSGDNTLLQEAEWLYRQGQTRAMLPQPEHERAAWERRLECV
ncbi:hypothetical protein [Paenibacillus glufosinatiresistens]|uniref:hypothetical protein n=1 Tax=Paenibacillus glufosinatiresistens TaxID=3070657 RepID=UPI00286E769F|nr:hypothetical protein [Paenibacillus sp. YX.27]